LKELEYHISTKDTNASLISQISYNLAQQYFRSSLVEYVEIFWEISLKLTFTDGLYKK